MEHLSDNASTTTKLKTARNINGISFDGSANISNFAVCDTASSMTSKTVACTGFTLVAGARISVQFKNGNSAMGNLLLNVNDTGNINVVDNQTDIYLNNFKCNSYVVREFIYDGSYWRML